MKKNCKPGKKMGKAPPPKPGGQPIPGIAAGIQPKMKKGSK